jgi:hypothetical protein
MPNPAPTRPCWSRSSRRPGARALRPAPLSKSGVERFLERSYGQSPAPEFVDGCLTATGGNPLLLGELTDALRAEGLEADADAAGRVDGVAPSTIARSVLVRLARLGPDAVAVAETVAVLSTDARSALAEHQLHHEHAALVISVDAIATRTWRRHPSHTGRIQVAVPKEARKRLRTTGREGWPRRRKYLQLGSISAVPAPGVQTRQPLTMEVLYQLS